MIVELPADLQQEARALISAGRKIEAVKRVREETGLGLEDALHLVEQL